MKHFKKLAILAMLAVLCVVLASCGQFVPSATLEVDAATGAGTARFTMVVPKNGANDVGNNWVTPNGDSGPNETGYLTSPEAVLNLFKSKVPSGFTVTMKEQTNIVDVTDEDTDEVDKVDKGSFDYTVTFSFTSIDDYNAKVKAWLPDKYWESAKTMKGYETDVKEATMTVEGDAANANVSLSVDMRILQVMCEWAWDISSTDTTGAVVDGGSGFDRTQSDYFNMDKGTFDVKFNGKTTSKRYSATKPDIELKATGVDTTATTTPGNPTTGDAVAVSAVVLSVAAAGVLLALRKRNK